MMKKEKVNYGCLCGMNFGNRIDNYNRHINKIKPCIGVASKTLPNPPKILQNPPKISQNTLEIISNIPLCVEIKPTDNKIEIHKDENKQKEEETNDKFCCPYCFKNFAQKFNLNRHLNGRCKFKPNETKITQNETKSELVNNTNDNIKLILKRLNDLENENEKLKKQIEDHTIKNNHIIKIHKSIKKLETNIPANTNLTISNQFIEKLIQKDKEIEELTIKHIPKKINKTKFPDDELNKLEVEIENQKDLEIAEVENNKPMTLILNNDVIEYRQTDGYINATQLCKAGGKKFNDWLRLENTKNYLVSMETDTGIPALELIDKNIGGNHTGTWVHPKIAVNLAQWLSPDFAVQVSNWIYDLMTKGKVEVNIKLLKEQENIIKTCKSIIKHLEDRILKKQPRPKYDNSKFVVYLATNKKSMKERLYTVGLARDLSERLSNYNKMEDHFPIYYKAFMDEEQMKVAESMVLNKLYVYREKESRDRFILPVGKDIKLFTKAIDDTFNFFNN